MDSMTTLGWAKGYTEFQWIDSTINFAMAYSLNLGKSLSSLVNGTENR